MCEIDEVKAMIDKEKKIGQSKINKTSKLTQEKLKKIGKDYEGIKTRVHSWKPNKQLTSTELKAKQIVDEVEAEKGGEAAKGLIRDQLEKTKHLWDEQLKSTKEIDEYNRLKTEKDVTNAQIDKDTEILYEKISKMPEETQKNARILLNSDYNAIRGMTKKQADELWNEHTAIRGICGREIDQMAEGLGSKSEFYGFHLKNALLITKRYPVLKGSEDVIDKLVSIKAMNNNNAWGIKIDSDIEYVLDVMKENHIASKEDLFANSPEKMVKGWRPEIYRGNLRPATEKELKKNPKKKFYYDADSTYEEGLIGAEMQNKKIGSEIEIDVQMRRAESLDELVGLSDKEMSIVKKLLEIKEGKTGEYQLAESIEDLKGLTKKELETVRRFKNMATSDEESAERILNGERDVEMLTPARKKFLDGLWKKGSKHLNVHWSESDKAMTPAREKYLNGLWEKGSKGIQRFNSLEEELKYMKQHRLRKVGNEYRRVADEKNRTELGKVESLADEVAEATRSIRRKVAQQSQVYKIKDNLKDGTSTLFSKEPREGFVQVTDDQKKHIPYELRKEFNYVNEDFMQRLLGRDEVRLYQGNKQFFKVTDRLVANLSSMFKQRVVLTNPVSYVNSFIVNQTIAATVGVRPDRIVKYQIDASRDIKEMEELYKTVHKRKLTGAKVDADLEKKLENNLLFRMEKAGLSTNRVEGLVGDEDLLSSMLRNNMHRWLFKTGQVLNFNQKTKAGRATLRLFSYIDTMGRYMIAKHYMDAKGMSIEEAVKRANGLFADMDKMVPEAIELLDKYNAVPLFVPFLKWFSLTSPMLLKVTKENPKKALGVAVGMYLFAQETDTNMATVNPIEAMVDFAEGSLPIGTIEKLKEKGFIDTMSNRAKSTVVPKIWVNAWDDTETFGAKKLLKPRIHYDLYKGFTQSTIEKLQKDSDE